VRIFVQHDEQGNIVSFAIPAKGSEGQGGFAPVEGHAAIEVDVGDMKEIAAVHGATGDRAQRVADVRDALQRHKVDVRSKKLVVK
jgi:hypothetical protein